MALGREHGLGAGCEAGDRLCQLVWERGNLMAVRVWFAAGWPFQGRDQTMGQSGVACSGALRPPGGIGFQTPLRPASVVAGED